MKKELRILVILIAVLLVGTVGYYFMPKKFGKNVNPSEVDHINVFDGNTGTGFTITDSEDIEYIVANIQGISMKLVDCLEKCLICRHIRRFAD